MAEPRPAPTFAVLYVGRGQQEEFLAPRRLLEDSAALACVDRWEQACELVAGRAFKPDLIVVEQPRPGEPQAVARLRAAAPLAGVWVLTGSWAEGEERTGRPSPLAERVAWTQFALRWSEELRRAEDRRPALWQAPFTTTPEERLLDQTSDCVPPSGGAPAVAIYSDHRGIYDWLVDLARACGAAPLASHLAAPARAPTARLAIADFDELRPGWLDRWRAIERATPRARRIVLLDFPRWQDVAEASAWGAEAVYAKPPGRHWLGRELELTSTSLGAEAR